MPEKTENSKKEKNNQKTLIICICILLIVIIIATAVVTIVLNFRSKDMDDPGMPTGYIMDESNYEQIAEEMDNAVREGYFETYMNTVWNFPDGLSETTDALLGNSPNNTKPIRCEVILDETEEVIYSTGVIPVGALVPAFKLDKDLDAGTYDATCMTYLLKEQEDGTYTDFSSAGFHVTIVVQN